MSSIRRIEPMLMPPDLVAATDFGGKPKLRWINPADLYVDGTYQREVSRRTLKVMKKMFATFAWSHMKVPNVVESGDKMLVTDGQHTAIVAASLGIQSIPILVVEAQKTADQARAFVGLNTDRVRVSPLDIYRALLASGDEDAMDVDNVCKRAGVRIRNISPQSVVAEGDTAALGTIQRLVKERGVIPARKVLEALVKAKRVPITPSEIKAADAIICKHMPDIEVLTLARAIRCSSKPMDAKHRAEKEGVPLHRFFEVEWIRAIKAGVAA